MLAGTDYEITEAEDGVHALAAVAKERPDLILMGIQLPIMDGYEVTRQIKADPAMRSIPIIAITSHALDGEEETARAAGCDGYVPEPYSPRQLLAKISSACPNKCARLLQCMSPLLAQSGHPTVVCQCPLLGVRQTSHFQRVMSAFDPKRTWGPPSNLYHLS
jgi:two-component system cell cycle response regulator DivK